MTEKEKKALKIATEILSHPHWRHSKILAKVGRIADILEADDAPPPLGINVAETIAAADKFGG